MSADRERDALTKILRDVGAAPEYIPADVDLLQRAFRQARALSPPTRRPGRPRDAAGAHVALAAGWIFSAIFCGRRLAAPAGWDKGSDPWSAFIDGVMLVFRGRRASARLARLPIETARAALREIADNRRN